MPQFNYLDMPKIDQQRQAAQYNALQMRNVQEDRELRQDARSEQERIENVQWLTAVGQYGMEQMKQDPNSYVRLMPEIEKEGQRRGVWEKIGIDYTVASPEVILEGFQEMARRGQVALAGMQGDRKILKDVGGFQRYEDTGDRLFPEAVAPLKAPTTRSIIDKDERIDQEFDLTTGEFVEVGRGPRSVVQRQETGPPGSFKTGSQTGAQEVEMENAASATIQAVATAGDLVDLVRSNKSIVGIPGAFFRITNDLAQSAVGIAQGLGVTFEGNLETLTNPENYDFSKFRGTAIDSAVMQSAIVNLAFAAAAASGQEGRSISDKDIQRFINEIGGSTSDPKAFEAVIRKFTERLVRNFTISTNVRKLNRPDLIQQVRNSLDNRADEATRQAQSLSGFNELSPSDQQELIQLLRERR